MEYGNLKEMLAQRYCVVGDLSAMNFYHWMAEQEDLAREDARSFSPRVLDLWQRAIELRSRPFMPGRSIQHPKPPSSLADWYQRYSETVRMYFLEGAVQTSIVAMNSCLDGYYTQCLTLLRTLLETSKRSALLRRSHEQVLRWIPDDRISEDMKQLAGYHRLEGPPTGPVWGSVFPPQGHEDDVQKVDYALISHANNSIEYLNNHTHPSMEGATQLMTDPNLAGFIHPSFSEHHMERCL